MCLINTVFKYNTYCIYIASNENLTQESVFLYVVCPLLWIIGLCFLSHRNIDLVKVNYIHDPSNPPSFFRVASARCYRALYSNLMLDRCSTAWHHAGLLLPLKEWGFFFFGWHQSSLMPGDNTMTMKGKMPVSFEIIFPKMGKE